MPEISIDLPLRHTRRDIMSGGTVCGDEFISLVSIFGTKLTCAWRNRLYVPDFFTPL